MSLQTDVPGDYHLLEPWFNVMRFARNKASTGGPAVLTLRVLVDDTGYPNSVWAASVTPLEPKQKAGETIEKMLAALGGDR